jgi:hypothetical protein
LLFDGYNGYANAPHSYVIHTLPVKPVKQKFLV